MGAETWACVAGVAIGLLIAAALLIRHIIRRRRAEAARVAGLRQRAYERRDPLKQETPAGSDPLQIGLGDVIDHLGSTYAVRGTITCTQGAYMWKEHHLDTGRGTRRWLTVEDEDGDVTVIMWTEVNPNDASFKSGRATFASTTFKLDEKGTASYTSVGTTGVLGQGTVEYADYEGPAGKWLARERFDGGEWEVAVGEVVPSGFMTIYPAAA